MISSPVIAKDGQLREGAWIGPTRDWHWVTEHASWIQKSENARLLGLSEEVQAELSSIPWDFNGPGRKAILRMAMDAGFIRVRGHGASVTFEFTLPMEIAAQALSLFMARNLGPKTWCRFNDLKRGHSIGMTYEDLCSVSREWVEKGGMSEE